MSNITYRYHPEHVDTVEYVLQSKPIIYAGVSYLPWVAAPEF